MTINPVWPFTEQPDKPRYNEGDKIATAANPVWSNDHSGVPITDEHAPCGYWFKDYTPMAYNLLYGAGSTNSGQLGFSYDEGFDENGYIPLFVKLSDLQGWRDVSAGGYHTVAVRLNGDMWGTGDNTSYQVGLSDNDWYFDFTQIDGDDWKSAHCGRFHTIAIKNNNSIWGTGANNYGQVGVTGGAATITEFTQIGSATDWIQISCGSGAWHSAGIRGNGTKGTLWVWGRNTYGQLGQGDKVNLAVPTQVG
ncbi:MAG: hypothetical protein JRE47_13585, partial [Deltaproteobacteria bacterium]|nr:hypothetical protein [Deltaproteobacteria bacterium]